MNKSKATTHEPGRLASMPMFYFHLDMCGKVFPDQEGRSFPNLEQARANAILDVRGLMAADVKAGCLNYNGRIDIADEKGAVILTVPFREAVELSGLDEPREHPAGSA